MCCWLWLAVLVGGGDGAEGDDTPTDLRTAYDVSDYRLDLLIDPERGHLRGLAGMTATVTAAELDLVVVDLERRMLVDSVGRIAGSLMADRLPEPESLEFERVGDQLHVRLPEPLDQGTPFTLIFQYQGVPQVVDDFTGFHVRRTPRGEIWAGPSVQTIGAHTWWPCKASFYHPEDKNERLLLNLTVPEGLMVASNGRLESVTGEGPYRTWRWRHDYPLPTYAVSFNIAPYELIEEQMELPGLENPLLVQYYVLSEDADKARYQFQEVHEVLTYFSEVFGPYPFPDAKFALAQAPYWGMEHSTVIAYGNSFPAWLQRERLPDPFEVTNRLYDYILIHEAAHEWWGNSVTASNWGDFWIHEGFATYAEALWVEKVYGHEAYLDFMDAKDQIPTTATVYRPHHDDAGLAYNGPHTNAIYDKGAYVLHMLRYVIGDEAFFAAVKDFALRYRLSTTDSADFQRICEEHTGSSLTEFFQPWLYGTGWPHYTVHAPTFDEQKANLQIDCRGRALFDYVMPLDVELICADGSVHRHRPVIRQGVNKFSLDAPAPVTEVRYPGFRWILCRVSYLP